MSESSVSIVFDPDGYALSLDYYWPRAAPEAHVTERIELETTAPHFGGVRWWMRCPACSRRVAS